MNVKANDFKVQKSKKELKSFLEELIDTSTIIGDVKTAFDNILKQDTCDDEILTLMLDYNISHFKNDNLLDIINPNRRFMAQNFNIASKMSKTSFNKYWDKSQKQGEFLILVISTNADENQIQYVWDNYVKKPGKGTSKDWLQQLKSAILTLPHCPEKIINRQLRNRDSIAVIASNPNLGNMPKALKAVGDYAKVHRYDHIFNILVHNHNVKWSEIANAIDLTQELKNAFGDGFMKPSYNRLQSLDYFLLRDDTPEKAKERIYKITKDERFLPDDVKEIFVF